MISYGLFSVILLEHLNQHFHFEFKKKEKFSASQWKLRLIAFVGMLIKGVHSLQSGEYMNHELRYQCCV